MIYLIINGTKYGITLLGQVKPDILGWEGWRERAVIVE